ncbi:MAG: preprotein translocase subunit SecE [Patescibacteria group bacterium]|nr:preprotein translocase subunit SecE [Patescibacteria group bacterium]MCL5261964.1 preprotein translocase subunit SecE [Patescibacteria group bacterium]
MALNKFIKNSYEELRKVNWPSRRETLRMVLIVVLFSAAVAILLSTSDSFFTFLLKRLILKI